MNNFEKWINKNNLNKYFTKKYFDFFIIMITFMILMLLDWDMTQINAGLFFLFVLLNRVKSQVLAKGAMLFLIFASFALAMNLNEGAEKMTVIAYSLLIFGIVTAIWEVRTKRDLHRELK